MAMEHKHGHFVLLSDLVEGIIRMMNSPKGFTGPVNLGNPSEFTMLALAELVLQFTGSKSKIIFKPLPLDDPKQRQPDITLAKKHLDWEATVSLEDGLKETIAYFKATM